MQPWTFFNQLQWSRNHWLILLSFLVLATVETQVNHHHHVYASMAHLLEARFGIGLSLALWLIMAARLASMLLGTYLIVLAIYFVGGLFGRGSNSQRVFFRRLAVVFTVVLAAFTVQALGAGTPWMPIVTIILYAWGAILGFFAIREQFSLNAVEAIFMSLFAFFLVGTTWQVSQKLFESAVEKQVQSLTVRSDAPRAAPQRKNSPQF